MMENFFINYFSNQSNTIFPENTSQKFQVSLPDGFLSRRLNEQKLLVGLKFISFSMNNPTISFDDDEDEDEDEDEKKSEQRIFAVKSSLVHVADRSDGNQVGILHNFYWSSGVGLLTRSFTQYIERPSFFVTSREKLLSAEFEFLQFNSSSGQFVPVKLSLFKSPPPIHLQVEVKQLSDDMELDHINLLASSADTYSQSLHPDNDAYSFTYEAPQIRIRDDQKWVMGLKSISIPSLVKNAYDPTECWVKYKIKFTPKENQKQAYLAYEESYTGQLRQDHYTSQSEVWTDLNDFFKTRSFVHCGVRIEELPTFGYTLISQRAAFFVHKGNLLRRPEKDSQGLFEAEAAVSIPSTTVQAGQDESVQRDRKRERNEEDIEAGVTGSDGPHAETTGEAENGEEGGEEGVKRLRFDDRQLPDEDDLMMDDVSLAQRILSKDIDVVSVGYPIPSRSDYPLKYLDKWAREHNLTPQQLGVRRSLAYSKLNAHHHFYVYFELSPLYARMLGIPLDSTRYEMSDETLFSPHDTFFAPVNVDADFPTYGSPDTILVNCDIIEDTVVGNNKFPVLRHLHLGDRKNERDKLQNWLYHIDHFQEIIVRHNPFRFRIYLTDLKGIPLQLQDDQVNKPGLDNVVNLIMKRVA